MPSMYRKKEHRPSETDNVIMSFHDLEEARKSRKANNRVDTDGIAEEDGADEESMFAIDNHLQKQLSASATKSESGKDKEG